MSWGRWILFLNGAPYSVVVGYLYVALALLTGLACKPRFEPGYVLTAEWRAWAAEKYRYSTTLGRGIIYHPSVRDDDPTIIDTRLERHERKHVWQVDDLMLLSHAVGLVVLAVTGNVGLYVGLWVSGGAWQLPNFIAAGLRVGSWDPMVWYRESEHERSAYSQTDLPRKLGMSWDELRELPERE